MKRFDVAVAIAFANSKVLIARRKSDVPFAGYWEFTGGKCQPGESPQQCVVREAREELGIDVHPVLALSPFSHQYSDMHVNLHPFLCTIERGTPQPIGCEEIRWVNPEELLSYQFPEANTPLVQQLAQLLPTWKSPNLKSVARRRKAPREPLVG